MQKIQKVLVVNNKAFACCIIQQTMQPTFCFCRISGQESCDILKPNRFFWILKQNLEEHQILFVPQRFILPFGDALPETGTFIQVPVGGLDRHGPLASENPCQQHLVFPSCLQSKISLAQCCLTSEFKEVFMFPAWQGHCPKYSINIYSSSES